MSESLRAWLRLSLIDGIGPATQRKLLSAFGLPEQIFAASRQALADVLNRAQLDALLAPANDTAIDAALQWTQQTGNAIVTLADEAYPRALLDSPDPPILLYVKGALAPLQTPALAIVGARTATPQGEANARAFAEALAAAGFSIVSGMALGIDAAAHSGALAHPHGHTTAVIGTGADRIYPAANQQLAYQIAERGTLISEFPLGTPPLAHHFPRRNRIIAGLVRGILVVEATVRSGSLITAKLAAEYGREVFAIPGSIHSPLSRGCHRLIREGAKLVETAEDILEELGMGRVSEAPARRPATRTRRKQPDPAQDDMPADAPGDPDSIRVLAALGHDPVDIDTLSHRSGLTVDALYAILLPMELEGLIGRLPGGRFQRL
jgi:DNA processing protein